MRQWALTIGLAIAISAGVTAMSDAAGMRVHLNASVATGCAVSEIDAEAWEQGILRVQTRCNAEQFSLRLMSGSETLDISEVVVSGAADARVREGRIWITQRRPGQLGFDVELSDAFALQNGALSVRLDAL
ncbi:MAG: hypothetical protein GYB36_05595 [Alphaproteobacteria bacterium]|nr:hypothetical protein [Alphaproteobacteria bacterium]